MNGLWHIPIRFKFMVIQLLAVTVVLGLIIFLMARVFHSDKKAYIHDLTAMLAMQKAEETATLIRGYEENLRVFAKVLIDPDLSAAEKKRLAREIFSEFGDFVSVSIYRDRKELLRVFNQAALDTGGLPNARLALYRETHPLPWDTLEGGEIFIENSTVEPALPTLTLALPIKEGAGQGFLLTAEIHLERFMRLAQGAQAFDTFLIDPQGTLIAHSETQKVVQRSTADWLPDLAPLKTRKSLGITLEYSKKGVEMIGGIAQVGTSGLISGAQIPKTAAYLTGRELLNHLIGSALVLLISAALLSIFFARRLTRPLEELMVATDEIGQGRFGIKVMAATRDEIGALGSAFNNMSSELKSRAEALEEAQALLIQSEKMAAFGQLSAGIAHEVKNPLAGILGYAQLSLRKAEDGSQMQKNLRVIEKETMRCKEIIDNLMRFARKEKVSHLPLDLNEVVSESLRIVDHQLTIHQVKLESDLANELPTIKGNPNHLQQVLLNLLINAQQAMAGRRGRVIVSTGRPNAQQVELRVADDGPGIAPEIQARIFEPFFTTKEKGEGTGLGLSVSYGIIQDHGGEIRIQSEPGRGTTFIISLPAATEENEDEPDYSLIFDSEKIKI